MLQGYLSAIRNTPKVSRIDVELRATRRYTPYRTIQLMADLLLVGVIWAPS